MVGASITKTAQNFGVSRGKVSKVKFASEKEKKTSSEKHKLSERDRWTFHRIVRKDYRNTTLKITFNLNERLQNPISIKIARRQFLTTICIVVLAE